MKPATLVLRGAVVGALALNLPAQDFVLSTPGSATWQVESTGTGTRTVFTIHDNTVLNWAGLNLAQGSSLEFNFLGGESVANFLGGQGVNQINGSVISNGVVGFFSPSASLIVNGDITAAQVTLSTLSGDAGDFADGGGFNLSGASAPLQLVVGGRIEATAGDVVLAGQSVAVRSGAEIRASGAILMGSGENVSVRSAGDDRISTEGPSGRVKVLGYLGASHVEVSARTDVLVRGTVEAPANRVFLEVGEGGLITSEMVGLIVNDAVFEGNYDPVGIRVEEHEGDAAPVISDSRLTIPALKRPDGTQLSGSRTVTHTAPMSASSDGGRDARLRSGRHATAKRESTDSLLKRGSFFGIRGSQVVNR